MLTNRGHLAASSAGGRIFNCLSSGQSRRAVAAGAVIGIDSGGTEQIRLQAGPVNPNYPLPPSGGVDNPDYVVWKTNWLNAGCRVSNTQELISGFRCVFKTAKQIGLTIPPNVLVRADKVIRGGRKTKLECQDGTECTGFILNASRNDWATAVGVERIQDKTRWTKALGEAGTFVWPVHLTDLCDGENGTLPI